LDAVPIGKSLIVVAILLLLILLSYRIGTLARITGFGTHAVRTIRTFDYTGEEAKIDAPDPEKFGQPELRSITTEEQTSRTIWDWMTALIISAVIGGGALFFTIYQANHQQDIQELQTDDVALQAYIDRMTKIMLDDNRPIRKQEPDSVVSTVVRVQTLTAMQRLDGAHNRVIITFLKESGLVDYSVPGDQEEGVLRLDKASLNGVDLGRTVLGGFNLRFAKLRGADLHNANLSVANLAFADLTEAKLHDAELRDADLVFANLARADLEGANFNGANLRGADLSGANLKKAEHLTQYQINQAGAGDLKTELPEGINRPSWWINTSKALLRDPGTDPKLRDPRFGISMVAFKSVAEAEIGDEIGIPKNMGTSGAMIFDVQNDGLARDAGLRPGDIIVKVGSTPVQGLEDVKGALHKADSHVGFTIKRYYFLDGWQEGAVVARLRD